jgi:restriction system protein
MKRNPLSPWNPESSCKISPEEFEKQVMFWLKKVDEINSISIKHRKVIPGVSGDYEIDVVAKIKIFSGAEIDVLVECKRYSRPVEREKLLSLYAKLQEVGAHKAMIFSTSGFQSGALQYAKDKGIACINCTDGKYLYETKDLSGNHKPPPWLNLPKYAAILLEKNGSTISSTRIDSKNIQKLSNFFQNK